MRLRAIRNGTYSYDHIGPEELRALIDDLVARHCWFEVACPRSLSPRAFVVSCALPPSEMPRSIAT